MLNPRRRLSLTDKRLGNKSSTRPLYLRPAWRICAATANEGAYNYTKINSVAGSCLVSFALPLLCRFRAVRIGDRSNKDNMINWCDSIGSDICLFVDGPYQSAAKDIMVFIANSGNEMRSSESIFISFHFVCDECVYTSMTVYQAFLLFLFLLFGRAS